MVEKIIAVIEAAEKKMGRQIPERVWLEVLWHSMRKCKTVGKDDDYLPILFENELHDYFMRQEINANGGFGYVQHEVASFA